MKRGLGGGLQHAGAAGGERRGDLAGGHGGGEVPGRDEHGDADRLVLDEDAVGAGGGDGELAVEAHRLLGEPAEELGGIGDLAGGVGQRLAVLERDELGQHLAALEHQLEAAAEDLRALARRRWRPRRGRRRGRRRRRRARPRREASATLAMTAPVEGSTTSMRLPVAPGTPGAADEEVARQRRRDRSRASGRNGS